MVSQSQVLREHRCSEEELAELGYGIARLYRWWIALVLLVLSVATVLDIVEDGRMTTRTIPLSELPAALRAGSPAAIETLALLVIVIGPILALITLIVRCARRGDRHTAALALLVLLVVCTLPAVRVLAGG